MTLHLGDLLHDRYRIRQAVAQGGMGSIYLADDERLQGRQCALKEVAGDPNSSPQAQQQAREQFYREASVLARLDHPSLPKVSDYFTLEDGRDFLVMDYVPGQDLSAVIEQARDEGRFLPEKDILDWIRQLIDGLGYLHSQEPPVLHRDIKPGNLKLTPHGTIKLVDFGLVKLLDPDEQTVTIVQGRGTAHYTPLEQYGGDTGHTDSRSDIYALGATLYHLVTSEPPVEAKQRFLKPHSLPAPRDINPLISPRTERAILWALNLHPDERPATVQAFREALFNGLFPDLAGQKVFIPASPREWIDRALADPMQMRLALIASGLVLLGVFATFMR